MVALLRKHLIVRILCAMTVVMILIAGGYIATQVAQTKSAVEEAINSYNIRIAESYAATLQTDRYVEFLKQPQETELYWTLREELDQFRSQIGARYVYFVRFDEQRQPLIMIDGLPKDDASASPINEVTDMPAAAADKVYTGKNASSPLIENPLYGSYLSAYVPLKAAGGEVVGALGIDTDAAVFQQLAADVIWESMPLYILMLVVTILLIGAIVWFVRRSMQPLQTVTASAEKMAIGDLAGANMILRANPVRSIDEIGTVYQAMLTMSEHLNERVRAVVQNVENTSDQLVASSQSFASHTDQMLQMGETMNGSVQHIYEGAHTQKKSADDSALAMEEIALGIVKIAESSSTVSDAAVQSLEIAQSGEAGMKQLNAQIRSISMSAAQTLDIARQLKGYTGEIEHVIGSVREFADQTKLLALNASIEAARAGEHGLGFMVVAKEVRKLADASASSVQQISTLLGNIEVESGKISDEMEKASTEIEEGVALSGQAADSFLHAVESFRLVSEQIMEVSAATEQLTAGSEEVAATVVAIADIASGISEQSEQIQQLTSDQLDMMKQIYEASVVVSANTKDMRQAIKQVNV
ncbi:methyl-accepting chemotaxis protein [Paenibacillus sp. FSL H8-0548]|uniref:methyl-accepting chemotaxis protein n=1 Tax=Paenibacillus sp. FSL H8-0548 TaxID=1920422 RepID=UPI00096E3538|nr:methyl-accepting chemotaxis protein [Paenibacillus sp. FSL H8-0548]OMF22518.1 methyl-accepting chemotaxis protein [Paenibacillus sp. FSL H8-0548]